MLTISAPIGVQMGNSLGNIQVGGFSFNHTVAVPTSFTLEAANQLEVKDASLQSSQSPPQCLAKSWDTNSPKKHIIGDER
ncbi:MAG: hypothetical protein VKJ24_09825 [Synechococcales bacterium]|nr:hypothetical protein [Synechococcales bacterium]